MEYSLKQKNDLQYGLLKEEEKDSDYYYVTPACDDHDRQAHKVILGCWSILFKEKLVESPCQAKA